MQPLRQRPGFQTDAYEGKSKLTEELRQRLRLCTIL
jgi:hypothetical protein